MLPTACCCNLWSLSNVNKAYGTQVEGVGSFIDQTHLGRAQIRALNNNLSRTEYSNPIEVSWQLPLILLLVLATGIGVFAKLRLKKN